MTDAKVHYIRSNHHNPDLPWYWCLRDNDAGVVATGGGYGCLEAAEIGFIEAATAMHELVVESPKEEPG